ENLVRRDMKEAKGVPSWLGQLPPVAARGFKQRVGADDVRLDEPGRTIDRTVDMALSGQMHDGIGHSFRDDRIHGRTIADIGLEEAVSGSIGNGIERAKAGRIGEAIDVDDLPAALGDEMPAKC